MSNRIYVERRETKRLYDGRTWGELRIFADNVDVSFSLYDDERDLQGLDLLRLLLDKQIGTSDDDFVSSQGEEYNEDVEHLLWYVKSSEKGNYD